MKCYKVVSEINGEYYSAMVISQDYWILYPVKKYVKPKFGKIFAFKDIKTARKFVENNKSSRLYPLKMFKAECIGYKKIEKPILEGVRGLISELIPTYWKGEKILSCHCTKAPKGTILCDKIKLLEQVEKREATNEQK